MKIAHLADIHIRFGSRHDEYRQVFSKLYEDLRKQKPDRIVVDGDLNHTKINMSPGSMDLSSEFLINLSKIAPTDVILGNHDMNISLKEQGDTITPILKNANHLVENESDQIAFIINEENKTTVNFNKKAIYFYPDSGFYDLNNGVVYGVYSCKDEKIISLTEKEFGKKYIALYHGAIYGCRGNNGHILKNDTYIRPSTFSNFDMVLMGDIHEYQAFRDDETMFFCGTLIQQDYSESIEKGYVLVNTDDCTHARKFIPNECGFARLRISRGEIVEQRLNDIKFSSNKKKTKVHIILQDFEENFSLEKNKQIEKLIKSKYGCEHVKVEFESLSKEDADIEDIDEVKTKEDFYSLLKYFIENGDYDCDERMVSDILELATNVDNELNIKEGEIKKNQWEINTLEVSNLFSLPEEPTVLNFEDLKGLVGIFGQNYSGKSNIFRSIIWALYQDVLDNGDTKKVVNIYTKSNKAYAKVHLTINGEQFRIYREIKTTETKSGEIKNAYSVEYTKLITNENGEEVWTKEISDKKAVEKKEAKDLIIEAIGTFSDFTKISLFSQNSSDDYLALSQQPKNDLINRYLGLHNYRVRHKYVNEMFNKIKATQKELGDYIDVENTVISTKSEITDLNNQLSLLNRDHKQFEDKRDSLNNEIVELTKLLQKKEYCEYNDVNFINSKIAQIDSEIQNGNISKEELTVFLNENFKRELSIPENFDISKLEQEFTKEDNLFKKEKETYINTKEWLKQNPIKEEISIIGVREKISDLNREISDLNSQIRIHKGESCPTCKTTLKQANPELEHVCTGNVYSKQQEIQQLNNIIEESDLVSKHNFTCNNYLNALSSLEISLRGRKSIKDGLLAQRELFYQSQASIEHNRLVDLKQQSLSNVMNSLESNIKQREKLISYISVIENNILADKHNFSINEKIEGYKNDIDSLKMAIYNTSQQINRTHGEVMVKENNIKVLEEKLNRIKEEERLYKKYSVYLQSVHRNGIPMQIIKNKLPIINNKINSLLGQFVRFRVDLDVLMDGNVVERFYYSEDGFDSLPLSSSSGAQRFIISLAIKDALNYISNVSKSSLFMIDEGFGTLDDHHVGEIINVLEYFKNKYKNLFIVTHRNEIKEFADHYVSVSSTREGITKDVLDKTDNAFITSIKIG